MIKIRRLNILLKKVREADEQGENNKKEGKYRE